MLRRPRRLREHVKGMDGLRDRRTGIVIPWAHVKDICASMVFEFDRQDDFVKRHIREHGK